MKYNAILSCLFFAITANLLTTIKAQVNVNDSLALVDLYNSTNGPHWVHHDNWLTKKPTSTWYGITVANTSVTSISLANTNLTGIIPSSIGNIVNLTNLNLKGNYPLSGSIPTTIGNLTNLIYLDLSSNKLNGIIPATIGNLVNLTYLNFGSNKLNGIIPVTIGNLTNLTYLYLGFNQLTGIIPANIGKLVKLQTLFLLYNKLNGSIPSSIGNLVNLTSLDFFGNNLSGCIPASISKLVSLQYLYLGGNQLSGTLPPAIAKLVNLTGLNLSMNHLSGTIPTSFSNLVNLTLLDLSYNQLTQDTNIYFPNFPNKKVLVYIHKNNFTFDGLEFIADKFIWAWYSPQTNIPVHQQGNILSVYAGGTLSNNTYQWFTVGEKSTTIIQGDSTFQPAQSGQYYAYITNAKVYKLTLTTDTITYTAPQQSSIISAAKLSKQHFSIYPNPATNLIHIQTNDAANFTLTNSAGKILLTKTINNTDVIDVSKYANGIYYLQNKTSGETQKIIVIH